MQKEGNARETEIPSDTQKQATKNGLGVNTENDATAGKSQAIKAVVDDMQSKSIQVDTIGDYYEDITKEMSINLNPLQRIHPLNINNIYTGGRRYVHSVAWQHGNSPYCADAYRTVLPSRTVLFALQGVSNQMKSPDDKDNRLFRASEAMLPPPSRKRPISSMTALQSKQKSSSGNSSLLRGYNSYFRQQYAFSPRWWLLFRYCITCYNHLDNPEKAVFSRVLQVLLVGKPSEQRILNTQLGIRFDSRICISTNYFDSQKLVSYLNYLLNYCEESICFVGSSVQLYSALSDVERSKILDMHPNKHARVIYKSLWTCPAVANTKEVKEKVITYRNGLQQLFSELMTILSQYGNKQAEFAAIMRDYLNQYLLYGYVDTEALNESVLSCIYPMEDAVIAYKCFLNM